MKKVLSLVLGIVLSFSLLAGCAAPKSEPAPSQAPAQNAEKPVEKPKLDYPKGDITFLIPSGAGGGNDMATRALIPGLQENLGVNLVPVNKGESKGAIACTEIATSKPDGQKLLFFSPSLILLPYGGLPDIKMENYQPVAQVADDNGIIYVKADASYKTIQEFVATAKEKKLKVAHVGVGSMWHLASVQFAKAASIDFQYVPYSTGGAQMLAALAAGEVDMCVTNPAEAKALVDSGKIVPLAAMGENRVPLFKDAPTLKEAGVDLVFPVWRIVFTTKGVSEDVLNRLDEAFKATVEGEGFQKFCENNSIIPNFKDHKETTKFFNEQVKVYAEVMKTIQ
ncbi:MAG: tripartite tricarboxylate transporter substrate binding protein [Clostridia bacterium]